MYDVWCMMYDVWCINSKVFKLDGKNVFGPRMIVERITEQSLVNDLERTYPTYYQKYAQNFFKILVTYGTSEI